MPYKHVYDVFIIRYMMREQAHFLYHEIIKPESIWKTPKTYTYGPDRLLPQTVSSLEHAIRKAGYRGIRKTIRKHIIDKMVREQHLLEPLPKERRQRNEKPYILNPKKLGDYALWYTQLVAQGLERGHFSSYFGYMFLGGK